jgi:AraC family transcriptional regulator, activator of mtrCDE
MHGNRSGARLDSSTPPGVGPSLPHDLQDPDAGLTTRGIMQPPLDWLSRLLDMVPVHGHLDLRCSYGAPWVIAQDHALPGEIPYHILVSGSAVLEDPSGDPPQQLTAGDILLVPHGAHKLHDGSGAPPSPARKRATLNLIISENSGTGDRVDILCGRFILTPQHERLLRGYLPLRLVVRAFKHSSDNEPRAGAQLRGLVKLMRGESALESLGGRAMLNALSTAMFALTLRVASESHEAPSGLLSLAAYPRLAPALTALFREPARAWTLPQLARLCHLSRATFARQFQERLGRSASDLLTDIRMTLAANELRKSSVSTAAVADMVGYQSEAAFQRAFKQRMGVTPAQWRRADHSPD